MTAYSNDDLKAQYDEYDAAGKFDYLKSYALSDMNLNVQAYNCFKSANIKNAYEFSSLKISDMIKFRRFNKKVLRGQDDALSDCHGFLFEPGFGILVQIGELDTYLAEGERKATERDPQWREKLGLAAKQQLASATDVDAKEKFVINHIAKSVDRIGRSFTTPLDKVHPLFGGDTIKELNGKTNADGETLDHLGDLVLAGRAKLIDSFGVTEEQIAVLDKTLPKYRLSLDMRDNAEDAYHKLMQPDTNLTPGSEEEQRKAAKVAYAKTFFTAP